MRIDIAESSLVRRAGDTVVFANNFPLITNKDSFPFTREVGDLDPHFGKKIAVNMLRSEGLSKGLN